MAFLKTRDGTHLRWKELGSGRPVVLIHGWPLSADSWDPVMMELADNGYRAIAYDRRGFGHSDHAASGYDYDTFADDLADVMKETGATENVALVGFSMGGGEIARYMSRHGGQGVTQAVLVSSVVPYMLKTDDNPDGVPQSTFDEMTDGMKTKYRHFFTGFFKDFYGDGVLTDKVYDEEKHWAWMTTMMASKYATMKSAEAFATTDFRPDLPSITVPTLVIHGTKDQTVPIDATGRAVAEQVPGATLIEYDGEPHAVFATQTERLSQDIVAFLDNRRSA
ncbi:alpha/beta fold hydrolase [Erythrobacter arachoides]|uniref:Alpha/beta fold hydrolase n=1 Tax=Aurantiacibacter arachoides TaxID=1850444 RepID=A0A845A034_9SPHN|nr:alpha/beta hydrolase [Aurantiacibacter arachoides]MXO93328.1 alpha/beta fold hydrolase [Aurantiacibacter arachoides]GGD50246.1 arylesterase [Aurantiacibacter arachoides]